MDQRSGDCYSLEELQSFRSVSGFFQNLRCWTGRLLLLWTRSSRIPTTRKRSASRNRKPRKRVDSFAEDRSLSQSTTIFVSLVLMIPFLIIQICSLSFFAAVMSRTSWYDQDPYWRCSGKSVQIKNTWIWSTQNRKISEILKRYWSPVVKSSKNGEEKYRSETQMTGRELRQGQLKEKKEFAISGKRKDSVREETNAVSDTSIGVQNDTRNRSLPLNHWTTNTKR